MCTVLGFSAMFLPFVGVATVLEISGIGESVYICFGVVEIVGVLLQGCSSSSFDFGGGGMVLYYATLIVHASVCGLTMAEIIQFQGARHHSYLGPQTVEWQRNSPRYLSSQAVINLFSLATALFGPPPNITTGIVGLLQDSTFLWLLTTMSLLMNQRYVLSVLLNTLGPRTNF